MESGARRCPGCKRAACDGCGIYLKLNTNKQARVQFPEGFIAEQREGLGLSFDVGTTSLAGMLWDLKEGALLDVEARANPQAVLGADVVSRVQAATQQEEALKRMQKLVIQMLDEMALAMATRALGQGDQSLDDDVGRQGARGKGCPEKVVIAGNTAMCEILMGMKPTGLSKAPFTPEYAENIRRKGECFGFQFLKRADVTVLPPIGGFVGADALAVQKFVGCKEKEKAILTIDIGTNGEILLQCREGKYACSVAAGPALEGGAVGQGMRAVAGAIDKVLVGGRFPVQDIICRVIGGGEPVGICGSGLVDALAALYRSGVLDSTGYMRSAREAKASGVPERICQRIKEGEEGRRFLLTDKAHPVYLLSGDVRQVQLAISAIRTGTEILLKKAGICKEKLDAVYLAGAFGSYIGIESGMAIGLFPSMPEGKIVQAGNLAGVGAAMALLSEKTMLEMEEEKGGFIHVELADEEGFGEFFLKYMNFPSQG